MPDLFKTMSPEEYMTERLDQYQQWYDRKSIGAKSRYMTMRAASVVGAAIVPVIVNLKLPYVEASYIATIISLGVVIVVSLESVYHFGDQWRNYRTTEQFLMREKVLFRTGDGPYRGLDKDLAFSLLVERCEAQISAENSATLKVLVVAAQQPEAGGTAGFRKS